MSPADNINAAIGIANVATPPANLCWSGSAITDEAGLVTAVSSGSVDLLIALNQNFFNAVWWDANATVVASALTAGTLKKKFMVYDRYADNDVKFPGLAPGSVVKNVKKVTEP